MDPGRRSLLDRGSRTRAPPRCGDERLVLIRATRWRTSASTSLKGPRPADHGLRPVLDDAVTPPATGWLRGISRVTSLALTHAGNAPVSRTEICGRPDPSRPHRRPTTVRPDLFSGWAIRPPPADHPAYSPFSYHRGSVWPVEAGTTGLGPARYGCRPELHRLVEGTFAAAAPFEGHRLPEVISGLPRDEDHTVPGVYPRACSPQAWSASAVVALMSRPCSSCAPRRRCARSCSTRTYPTGYPTCNRGAYR